MKIAGSLVAVGVATALVFALKPVAPVLSLGVVYVLAVLAAAVVSGLAYAVAAAVVSMVAFNFLFLPPVHTLTLADGRNWAALAVYLVTAVVASQLATSARRRAIEAEQREREAALLSDAAAAVLREEPLDEIRARLYGDELAHERFEAGVAALLEIAEQRRAAEELRRSDAIKTVILQTVSHDFRTPVATIRAAVDGLQDPTLALGADGRRDLLDSIAVEVARLSRLVENVLDLSRLQTGTTATHLALWHVDDLVGQTVDAASDARRLDVRVEPGLPPVRVDAVQIQRALVNLVENALKFAPGPVEVAAYRDGGAVAVDVRDRGPGHEDAPSTARGLGLGLEIARGFATANDARLEVRGRHGGGTSARLVFGAAA